jgi:hypothetical protein
MKHCRNIYSTCLKYVYKKKKRRMKVNESEKMK